MTERNETMTRIFVALARRLLFVVFFVFGLGEGPFGGENAGVRSILEADRALAFTAGAAPLPTQFATEAERADHAAPGMNGGEEQRTAGLDVQPPRMLRPAAGVVTQRRPDPAPTHGFSSRAPPALT